MAKCHVLNDHKLEISVNRVDNMLIVILDVIAKQIKYDSEKRKRKRKSCGLFLRKEYVFAT